MNNEKKIAFQAKRIIELEKENKSLREENGVLETTIQSYEKIISEYKRKEDSIFEEYKKNQEEYLAKIKELQEIKANYSDAIKTVYKLRHEYNKNMKTFMKQFRIKL